RRRRRRRVLLRRRVGRGHRRVPEPDGERGGVVSELLPHPGDRIVLVDQLAKLIGDAGWETFVAAPLVEPTDRWFPARWTGDAGGIERLIRRVLDYAGLNELALTLEIDRYSSPTEGELAADGSTKGHHGTAAWFAGISGKVCSFGVDLEQAK